MSGPGEIPFGGKAWYPEQERQDEEHSPWPETARSSITLPDGGKVPTYFCVRCEDPAAVEGRPTTPELLEKHGADATLHICFTCAYVREVAYPADAKGEPV